MIIGLAGISGVGKTSLIQETSKTNKVNRISSTKLLMKCFGIINSFEQEIKSEDYLRLESFSMQEKEDVQASEQFVALLKTQIKNDCVNIYEIHFVSPNRTKLSIDYQAYPIYEWYFKVFDGICYLSSNSQNILQRKLEQNERDRGINSLESTQIQKLISDTTWNNLVEIAPKDFKLVELINLQNRIDQTAGLFINWTSTEWTKDRSNGLSGGV